MNGRLLFIHEALAMDAHTVQAKPFATTIACQQEIQTLLNNGIRRKTYHLLQRMS